MGSEITRVSGHGIPLKGSDIDTDRIIPARFLRCVTFDGLGQHVFADDRQQANGQHSFDQPQYQGAEILVVNSNFGCGSSREHAPQALAKWGIQALIGESFAEIFFGNCVALGIPCLTATPETVEQLQTAIATTPQLSLVLDLVAQRVTGGDRQWPAHLADGARHMFLGGTWDSCGQLVANVDQVRATMQHLPYLSWSAAS
ncbi:MAG: 3-isopropylmalate dehydratase small subunit [Spirulinaceae cyanobacterium RM2_2_10]|nr:3-isopropylmalate dehydratase small subunit [Spirulinaceae cyanobacterium SM2_1_0]NJO19436.1 3-isopropylmalate dehydratase small subunit [Spirulinaceae cyanobacterium RM2_2_10]